MTFEEQNELIKANIINLSDVQIRGFIKQFTNYNTFHGAYSDMIEILENELANRK